MAIQSLSKTDPLAAYIVGASNANNAIYNDTTGYISITKEDSSTLRLVKADGSGYTLAELAAGLNNLGNIQQNVTMTYTSDPTGSNPTTSTVSVPVGYQVTFPDNSTLSVGNLLQLVIVICLNKAAEAERTVASLMEEIAQNSNLIASANSAAETLLTCSLDGTISADVIIGYCDEDGVSRSAKLGWVVYNRLGITTVNFDGNPAYPVPTTGALSYGMCQAILTEVSNKLDSLNSLSQERMITLQAYIDKRDQAYELSSNITKLFGTGFAMVARNV